MLFRQLKQTFCSRTSKWLTTTESLSRSSIDFMFTNGLLCVYVADRQPYKDTRSSLTDTANSKKAVYNVEQYTVVSFPF